MFPAQLISPAPLAQFPDCTYFNDASSLVCCDTVYVFSRFQGMYDPGDITTFTIPEDILCCGSILMQKIKHVLKKVNIKVK